MTDDTANLIDIDQLALDKEWLKQAPLYYAHAEGLAEAKRLHADKKAALDVVEAELQLLIRSNPQNYDLEKVTEATIDATVKTQPLYQKAVKKLNEAKYGMDMAQAAVDALEHRKKALENLVFLHGQNYFSTPKDKGQEMAKRAFKRKGDR